METNSTWAITGWAVGALSLLGLIIRQIGPWRKQVTEAEQHFRDELIAREAILVERVEKLERRLQRQQLRHNAERSLDNHQLRNITACFDSMLLLTEMNPERGPEIVEKIKQMRATQMLAETEEKAIIRAAEITADEQECDHDGN